MEAPGGQQEPAAGAAGSGPSGSEEIDLSLDDIIKRNKKGHIKAAGNRWRPQLKKRNPPYSNGKPRFRRWAPQSVQGPFRFRGGFRKQQYYRKPFWNGMTGPRQRTATGPNGRSPLNRPASAEQQGKQDVTMMEENHGGVVANPQQRQPTRVKQFRRPNAFPPTQRPFQLNRRPAFMQRQSRFTFNRGQKESSSDRKQPRMRRWKLQPSSGAVLTISVSNLQANQMKTPGGKRPFMRGRSTPTKMTHPKPKGVPLRFNFRAMANQTSLTLNERFSGLWHKRRFTALRNTSRMVTLP